MKISRRYKIEEGKTDEGRYFIRLLDAQGRMAHESKGNGRWEALYGLAHCGFEIEWEPGETPEPKPKNKTAGTIIQ